jgi:hypothetical protein
MRTGRTEATRPTRPRPGELTFEFNPEIPDNLNQVSFLPFYRNLPELDPGSDETGRPDLLDPPPFVEESHEVNINGRAVCVTRTTHWGPNETVSQTFCFFWGQRPPQPPPQPPPADPDDDWMIDWPNLPPLPNFPSRDPEQIYHVTLIVKGSQTDISIISGVRHITVRSQLVDKQVVFTIKGPGRITTKSFSTTLFVGPAGYPGTVNQFVEIRAISVSVFYETLPKGECWINGTKYNEIFLYACYSWSNGKPYIPPGYETVYTSADLGGQISTAKFSLSPQPPPASNLPSLPSPQPPIDMNCCRDVRRLLLMVARLQQRVGVFDFPVPVPRSLLNDRGNEVDQMQNLPQLISWFVKQVDSLVGELPVQIEVEDIDPQTEGNQKQTFKFPTLADLMAELMGLALNNKINTETALTAILNTMVEVGSTKTTAIASYHNIQAVLDYLGANLRQSTVDVPLTFTPGETKIDKLFKASNTKVKIAELDSKTDLQNTLVDLKKFAAEWRAQNFRRIKLDGNEGSQILKLFKEAASLLSDETPGEPGENNQTSDFSSFTESAERGFTDTSGITDTINPYGRPYSQRPKIREIGNTSDRGTESS